MFTLEDARLREFAKDYTAAWCGQNPASVAAFYSLDGSLTINDGPPAVGRDAIAESARSFMVAFPGMKVSMDDVAIRGGEATYHWTLAGSNTGPGGTGRRVRFSGFEVWKFGGDGLIAESRGHFDTEVYKYQVEHGIDG